MSNVAVNIYTINGAGVTVQPGFNGGIFNTGQANACGQAARFPYSGNFDATRGYVFVINPATLQPQVPRSTTFPGAQ